MKLVWILIGLFGASPASLVPLACVVASGVAYGAHIPFIDERDSVFFPESFGKKISLIRSFPATWWNFVVFEPETSETLEILCTSLRHSGDVDRVMCGDSLSDFEPLIGAWARDIVFRRLAPSQQEFQSAFNESLAEASLPVSSSMLAILRRDPFGDWRELYQRATTRAPIKLEKDSGTFRDPKTNRWVIPFHTVFGPDNFERTQHLLTILESNHGDRGRLGVIGPHQSAFENRSQIHNDLSRVSQVGIALLCCIALAVWRLKRWRLVFALPLVFLGATSAGALMVIFFGSIHGLVISFGAGIVGLALDYAFHAAFASQRRSVWSANIMGVITSNAVFAVLWFSKIPLLKQLASFSILGLTISFGLVFAAHRWWPATFEVSPLSFRLGWQRTITALSVFLALGIIIFEVRFRPSFSLRDMDYHSKESSQWQEWLMPLMGEEFPLFEAIPDEKNALAESHQRLEFGKAHGLNLHTPAQYLPLAEIQNQNLDSWIKIACPIHRYPISSDHRSFFAPFLADVQCDRLRTETVNRRQTPLYVSELYAKGHWLTVWLPRSESERRDLMKKFPESLSLKDFVNRFPKEIADELKWMTPLATLIILAILWAYFRKFRYAMCALLPVAAGVGAIGWAHLLGMPVSFVSLVGILMLLGLGVDYGVFAVEHAVFHPRGVGEDDPINSALILCAVSTVGGYLPLLFCRHQVLLHLGEVLTLGTLGCSLASFWAIPTLLGRYRA